MNEDTFAVVLWSGEEITVTQSSSAFAPRLRITRGDDALAEGGGTGGTATIDYAADGFDLYVIHASSGTAGETGQYTLSTAYKSATMLSTRRLPSLNAVFPGEARKIGR
jgi:hypothetical protein